MLVLFGFAAWIVFCVRDYCLLETAASNATGRVLRIYLASLLATAALVTVLAARLEALVFSGVFLAAALAAHAAVAIWCASLRRRAAYSAAWKLAACPAPAAWILLLIAADRMAPGIAVLSGAAIAYAVSRSRSAVPSIDHFVFVVRFANGANCLALCLLPLMADPLFG